MDKLNFHTDEGSCIRVCYGIAKGMYFGVLPFTEKSTWF